MPRQMRRPQFFYFDIKVWCFFFPFFFFQGSKYDETVVIGTHIRLPADTAETLPEHLTERPKMLAKKALPVLSKKRKVVGRSPGWFTDFPSAAYTGRIKRVAGTVSSKKKPTATSTKVRGPSSALAGGPRKPLIKPGHAKRAKVTQVSAVSVLAESPKREPVAMLLPRSLPKPKPMPVSSTAEAPVPAVLDVNPSFAHHRDAGQMDHDETEVSALVKRAVSLGKQSGAAWLLFVGDGGGTGGVAKSNVTATVTKLSSSAEPRFQFEEKRAKKTTPIAKKKHKVKPAQRPANEVTTTQHVFNTGCARTRNID